jgi:dihydroorotate dehydrogenase
MRGFPLIRPVLHMLPPEAVHNVGLWALSHHLVPPAKKIADPSLSQTLWGLTFPNPVGLAAGFDKNAVATEALLAQGFGFVEAGTVTPRSQEGNPKPRIFRLMEDEAVINRLGFNNDGLQPFVHAFSSRDRIKGVVGANLGKNKDSEDAVTDYLTGLERVYPYADYITINISSPNTQGLRALQKREALNHLLSAFMQAHKTLASKHGQVVPVFLKIAPDLDEEEIGDVVQVTRENHIQALIVSNTTIKRPRTLKSDWHGEQGGLSGKPLFPISTDILKLVYRQTKGEIPLIGVGGIASAEDAYAKIKAGATLVQLYSALVYQGFGLVNDIVDGLSALLLRDGFKNISEAIGTDAT